MQDQQVLAEVMNCGQVTGDVLIQVYVSCDSPFAPLHPRLCGFRKANLAAGEQKSVLIPLDPLTDTVIDDAGSYLKAGEYTLYVGLSQPDEQSIRICGVRPVTIRKQTEV